MDCLLINKPSFHPTLVLAQRRGDREITLFSCKVSIPHWFSLNVIALALAAWGNSSFPSHIGSRSTRGRLDKVQQKPRVSIPHWFSLNAWEKIGGDADSLRFPSHIGSRSTLAYSYSRGKAFRFPSHIGSRSTWFAVE